MRLKDGNCGGAVDYNDIMVPVTDLPRDDDVNVMQVVGEERRHLLWDR